ncbi:MAG: alpha-galactosidase [Planctomycetes bacterium RBG_13_44_8b]|nr:MAG: alpha-galactosidase [Planctomycetes bacterium RBG_13_44_8b]
MPVTLWAQKFEGLALTPPMGWNTWNTFGGNINEDLIKGTATAMINNGMLEAGYKYIVLDDAWMTKKRDAQGNLIPDPNKFPSGMKALGDFLHNMGFKFGIYNCAGNKTCAGYPGGRGHEYQDARLYASWGVDYLKYDWCETGTANAPETYKTMRDALYTAGRPIVFSLCEWGNNKPWEWAKDVGHLWRTTGDIADCWDCKRQWSMGFKLILDKQVGLEKYAGPDHWNDPDMMEVGNKGLTLTESRAHFSLWCILAAPLMAGNDVRIMTDEIRNILTDKEVIALDQDPLGKQGYRFAKEGDKEVWVKELSDGAWGICVLNAGKDTAEMTVNWKDLSFLKGEYKVRELWQKKDIGTTNENFSGSIGSHDVVLFKLSPVQ